jgi:hypothetical protein
MSVDEIKTMVRRFLDEPWNKGNVDVIDELCAPDYTVGGALLTIGGREDLKEGIRKQRAASPDLNADMNEIIVEDDRVAYHWTMTGTYMQGKSWKFVGITLLRLDKGKIVEDRFLAVEIKQEAEPA